MKKVIFILTSIFCHLGFSYADSGVTQPLQGLKPDLTGPLPQAEPSPSPGFYLLQMAIVLLVVVGLLKWAMPKWLTRLKGKLNVSADSSIKIEESATFASGMLYVVSVREKTLLLSVSNQGITCLMDLTPGVTQKRNESELPAFFEMLDDQKQKLKSEEEEKPKPNSFEKNMTLNMTKEKDTKSPLQKEEIQSALEKLNRLMN